jgi:signal transduction histidine kinase
MLSWRSFEERERSIESLRPFVTSQQLYDRLLDQTPASPPGIDAQTPFRSLCRDVLGTRLAYLLPLGSLAPLAGPTLVYPEGATPDLAGCNEIAAELDEPQALCIPAVPERCAGASWVVPLWSERGLTGALFLGEKPDGSLYSQEEIEIARAMGERLVDTLASAEIARRLMDLQRQRLVESQVLDRQARRVLHDEVLPELHAAMLSLGNRESGQGETDSSPMELLAGVHRRISDLLRGIPAAGTPELNRLGLTGGLRQLVESEFQEAFDQVTWSIAPEIEARARNLPALTAEAVYYAAREAIRNAARHARGATGDGPLRLEISARCNGELELKIEDNGVGLGERRSGQEGGQGLALHSTMMAVVGGTLSVESVPGEYTRVTLALPVN